jgi:hypothetical protein
MFSLVIRFSVVYHHGKGNAGGSLLGTNLENDEKYSVNKTAYN